MNDFYQMCVTNNTDKCTHHGYHYFYPRFLDPLRNQSFNMLEIGYHTGDSARMWCDYFPNSKVFIMDIDHEITFEKYQVFKGDQSNLDDLVNVKNKIETAKFIIDDGSHHPYHQIQTFEYFFKNLLEDGGVYIIEDIETNYWRSDSEVYGYKIGYFNSIDYTSKYYIDKVNSEFSKIQNDLRVSSITYGQNCIIITKQTQEESNYFNRNYRYDVFL